MSENIRFDNILDECIEKLLNGESIESCLSAYPEYAAELEPLLRTAVSTWNATDVLPRPEFRQRAAYEFQAAIRDVKPRRSLSIKWPVRWVATVSGVMVVLLAGTGTVAAASNSLPDEPLYGVKLFTEDIRLALTPSAVSKANLYSQYTDERVAEIIKMADEGKVAQVEKVTERMTGSLAAISKLTQPDRESSSTGEAEPETFTTESRPAQAEAPLSTAAPVPTTDLPSSAKTDEQAATPAPAGSDSPVIIVTPTPVTGATQATTGISIPLPTPASTSAPAPSLASAPSVTVPRVTPAATPVPASVTPADSSLIHPQTSQPTSVKPTATDKAVSNNNTRPSVTVIQKNGTTNLHDTVSRQATKNTDNLKEALKRVPDSVKPSLEKAIDRAGKGYEEALKNIGQKK